VVLCTFNGALYIEEQLRTILAQTYPIQEILVLDDQSGDATMDIVRELAIKHPVIKPHQNEKRLGAVKNFEKALQLAANDLIAIADQDDVWHPQKIEKLVHAFPPDSLLIYCNSARFYNEADFSVKTNPRYLRFSGKDGRKILLFNTISGHAMLIRRQLLPLVLPFQEAVLYDWWMAMVAAYHGGVSYLPEVLVLQRMHGNNLTTGSQYQHRDPVSRKKFREMVLPHLKQFVQTPGMPRRHREMAGQLFDLWRRSLKQRFCLPLFIFLWRYRKIIFSFQKKKIAFFSHLKYCWWFSAGGQP
jgi:glycosyltransferase involved in cell wall biosynthesis